MKLVTIAMVCSQYFSKVNVSESGETYLSGVEGRYIDTILTAMGRLKYKAVIPKDEEWGRKTKDGNWTGIIGMLHRNEADLGIAFLRITEERAQDVDFSNVYAIDKLSFITQTPGTKTSVFAFVYPFEYGIWIDSLGSLLLMSLMGKVLDWKANCGLNVYKLLAVILHQSQKMVDGTLKGKLFIGRWSFFALVMSASYSGKLLSFMTVPLKEKAIEDFHQMSQVVQKGNHKFYTLKGSHHIHELLDSNPQNKILGEIVRSNQWYLSYAELTSGKYINRQSSVLWGDFATDLYFSSEVQERITISKDQLADNFHAIALRILELHMDKSF
ncbi:hypothetical protein JTE90_022667 [Oedothorax gibbosus]|uniref:Ionotropic glutamate receptor L-glutamate and glycine-binding domain-containing protein n=1 Tax=Oedothorax gibbosus TaxID=931172 RepID=A0AAV6ULW1_9ARAC|nr:hypothetical protein JTE90_022667 [Oedothorax gibbosus]